MLRPKTSAVHKRRRPKRDGSERDVVNSFNCQRTEVKFGQHREIQTLSRERERERPSLIAMAWKSVISFYWPG